MGKCLSDAKFQNMTSNHGGDHGQVHPAPSDRQISSKDSHESVNLVPANLGLSRKSSATAHMEKQVQEKIIY